MHYERGLHSAAGQFDGHARLATAANNEPWLASLTQHQLLSRIIQTKIIICQLLGARERCFKQLNEAYGITEILKLPLTPPMSTQRRHRSRTRTMKSSVIG